MDTKRLFLGMVLAMAVVIGWNKLVIYVGSTHPEWGWATTQPSTTEPSAALAPPTTQTVEAFPQTVTPATTQSATTQSARFAILPATRPTDTTLGSSTPFDPAVNMALSISPHGAGLEKVLLNKYRRTVESPDLYIFQEPYGGPSDDNSRSLATRSIMIDGASVNLLDAQWDLVSQSKLSATYRVVITRDGVPAVRVEKIYTLGPASTDDKTPQGYEVTAAYKVTNLTGAPLTANLTINGTTTPPRENDRYEDRAFIGGYLHDGYSAVTHGSVMELTKEKPTKDYSTDDEQKPLLWVGIGSAYFNGIVRSDPTQPIKITKAVAVGLNVGSPTEQQGMLQMQTNDFKVAPGATAESTSQVFFGPKRRDLLNIKYYHADLLRYDDTLVLSSGMCAFITSTKIIDGLYAMLSFFHFIFGGFIGHGDWGLAIICLVFVVRACLHPITKKSQVNMAKMSKMGPEIERLKKKHGDNKDELNKAMMQFYKTQGATPILGCLPMFLQMPIWIALYAALQSTFELRQAPFLWGFTWIKDLAHADRLIYFPDHPVTLLFLHIDSINVLPVLLAIFSWIQAKITRSQQPPAATPEAAQQQKMMQWMTLLMPVILYTYPSGLNLYIMTSSIFGIVEAKIVRKHIVEREAAEKAGAVIVDSKPDDLPPPGSVRRKGGPKEPEPKPTGILGWIGQLQRKAEEMQKEQLKKGKKK